VSVSGPKRPRDLALLPWTLTDRIAAAKNCEGGYDFKLVALTITLADYPDTIPVNNCCGAMCRGQYSPWGTRRKDWGNSIPAGYAMLDANTPLIAFQAPKDSLQYLIQLVERRRILQPDEFASFWRNAAAGTPAWGDAMLTFERCLNEVISRY
jgi:hypothetical protein